MVEQFDTAKTRRWFAEDLRIAAPVINNLRIIDAFAAVPREDYLGAGPWTMLTRQGGGNMTRTPSARPQDIYHDLPVTIDAERKLNNGQPSLWAYVFDHLGISNGDTVVQVGAATGYYTAILAELVGPNGCIIAYETLEDLAERAANSLRCYSQAEVRLGDATQASDLPELDIVVVCAGVTHVPEPWLDNLSDGGRMMLPFTGTKGWGFLMHLRRTGRSFPIRSLGPCGFYDCEGARRDDEAQALTDALVRTPGRLPELNAYHPGSPPKGADNVFYASAAYWISKA